MDRRNPNFYFTTSSRFLTLKPCSDCQPKSDFCANPIEILSYLDSLNGNELHEIRFVQIRFELHSYVVWNPN